jgi:hypothetical protein
MNLINGKSYKDFFLEQLVSNCRRNDVGLMFCDNPNSPTKFSLDDTEDENYKWYIKTKFNHGIVDIKSIKSHVYVTLNSNKIGFSGAHLYFSINEELIVIELSKCTETFINSVKSLRVLYGITFNQIMKVECEKDGYMLYI